MVDLETGAVTRLGLAGSSPRAVLTGHLIYAANDGSLHAVGFDTATFDVIGSPVPVVDHVTVKRSGPANFSISDDGRLVYSAGTQVSDVTGECFVGGS